MKKTILAFVLLLCVNLFAQSRYEFSLYGGGGWSTVLYDKLTFPPENGNGGGWLGGLGYTFFFSDYSGLGLGAELAYYKSKLEHDEWRDRQRLMTLQIPLMLQFQGGDWHKFYFAAGAKAGVPLYNGFSSDDPVYGGSKPELKTPILASAEMGMKWKFKEHVYLYTGAYLDYGLNSILRKTENFRHYDRDMVPAAIGIKLKLALGGGSIVEPPVLQFGVGQDSISVGQSTVLNWIALNADEVNIGGIGPVPSKGSVKINPSETVKYTISAKGRGGVKLDSVLVAVRSAPAPSIAFTASPRTIYMGQTAILNWMVSEADEINMEGVGPISDKGSREVKPSTTAKYFLTAKGKGGIKTDSVEIVVEIPPGPSVIFNATPGAIQRGQTAKLNWITTDAEEVSIEGIGHVSDKGSREVHPSQTTKYILTAKGKGSVTTQVVELIVEEPPPIEEKVNLKGVNFLPGKAVLSLDAKRVLDGVAEQLLAYPNVKIEIQGHSDNLGKAATNLKLSESRAKAVVSYLATKGVKINRMKATGYGSNMPIADNSTEEGREINRRIEMIKVD